jgi:hypothetical protein
MGDMEKGLPQARGETLAGSPTVGSCFIFHIMIILGFVFIFLLRLFLLLLWALHDFFMLPGFERCGAGQSNTLDTADLHAGIVAP